MNAEITQLNAELDGIAERTQFNGKKLLDGNLNTDFQIGANAGQQINLTIGTAMSSTGLAVGGVAVDGNQG
ncbi:flagellin N-terminal helical domain-containing protein [Natronincola ferrireducens]|uniref:flagellin N-terminal helical domain-containing protein n=1 Tax=Natronincola ferrireducens TaxID=393762 RepID=UPI00244E9501|nr:hypothetical protein [Natronincola ferrireducens]